MKVLIVNTVALRLNGITSVIMNYYRNMDRTDMQVDFVVINELSDAFRAEIEGSGATVHHIARNSNPLKYMWRLYGLMKKGGYDIVHIHGNSAMMLLDVLPAVWARIPERIVHAHSTSCSHMILHKLLGPLFHRCYTYGFACGDDAGRFLYGKRPFTVLKNGIELEQYRFDTATREEYRNKIGAGERTVIGHVANFSAVKNHDFLIDAFAKLIQQSPDYMLLLIGSGELMKEMRAKVEALGLQENVLFLGKTTDVHRYMQAMDVFVLPSLFEGLPVVLVEAQASGLPCLVSDRVAAQANLTGELQYLSIEDTTLWAQRMADADTTADRAARCEKWQQRVVAAGYDVAANAQQLKAMYLAFCDRQRQ